LKVIVSTKAPARPTLHHLRDLISKSIIIGIVVVVIISLIIATLQMKEISQLTGH